MSQLLGETNSTAQNNMLQGETVAGNVYFTLKGGKHTVYQRKK